MSETLSAGPLENLAAHLTSALPGAVLSSEIAFGELTVVTDLAHLTALVAHLRDDPECRFSSLVDITAVDHPENPARFEMVYHFLSMYQNHRIRVKAWVGEADMVPAKSR